MFVKFSRNTAWILWQCQIAIKVLKCILSPICSHCRSTLNQFSCLVVSDSLQPRGLQHAKFACPSSTPGACSNSCPSSQWYHPTISSSAIPFSSCLQSFPALGSFPMSQFFSLLQHHSSKASILQQSAFFMVQLSHLHMTTGKTIALTRWTFVSKVMSLIFNMLSRLVITFFPRSKCLLISWVQSPSAVILEPPKIKSVTVPIVSPSVLSVKIQVLFPLGMWIAEEKQGLKGKVLTIDKTKWVHCKYSFSVS